MFYVLSVFTGACIVACIACIIIAPIIDIAAKTTRVITGPLHPEDKKLSQITKRSVKYHAKNLHNRYKK